MTPLPPDLLALCRQAEEDAAWLTVLANVADELTAVSRTRLAPYTAHLTSGQARALASLLSQLSTVCRAAAARI